MDQDSSIVVEPSEMEQVDRLLTRARRWNHVALAMGVISIALSIAATAINIWTVCR